MTRQVTINLAACALLLAQYLLGMVVNLYVDLPTRHPGAGASNYFSGAATGLAWLISNGPAWASAHAALGMTLAALALAAMVLAWRRRGTAGRAASVIGALAVIGAGFNGTSFLNYGHDFSSLISVGDPLVRTASACPSDAVRVDLQQDGDAVPGPADDLGLRHPGVQPQRYCRVRQVVGASAERRPALGEPLPRAVRVSLSMAGLRQH